MNTKRKAREPAKSTLMQILYKNQKQFKFIKRSLT